MIPKTIVIVVKTVPVNMINISNRKHKIISFMYYMKSDSE